MQIHNKIKAISAIGGSIIIAISTLLFNQHSHVDDRHNYVHVIVDSGHGSIHGNKYQTAGKQSPRWACGLKIYEGHETQHMAFTLAKTLLEAGIEVSYTNAFGRGVPLPERVSKINSIVASVRRENPNMHVIGISLHLNAQPTYNADYIDSEGHRGFTSVKTGGATGMEAFTSHGWTEADEFLEYFLAPAIIKMVPELRWRYGNNRYGKEANFTILRGTTCPFVLLEFGFMTTYTDCLVIINRDVRERYIQAIVTALRKYNEFLKNKYEVCSNNNIVFSDFWLFAA